MAALVWDDLRRIDILGFEASTDTHFEARQGLLADPAYEGCVPRDAIVAAAEARDFFWQDRDALHWCHVPAGLTDWLHVQISPPLPFSNENENAAFFGLDGEGCIVRWESAAGAGSTCPVD